MVIKISTAFLSVPITLHNSTPSYHRAIRGLCGTTREVSCHLSLLLNIWPVWERIIIAYSEFRRLPHGSFVLCSVLLESVSTPPPCFPTALWCIWFTRLFDLSLLWVLENIAVKPRMWLRKLRFSYLHDSHSPWLSHILWVSFPWMAIFSSYPYQESVRSVSVVDILFVSYLNGKWIRSQFSYEWTTL